MRHDPLVSHLRYGRGESVEVLEGGVQAGEELGDLWLVDHRSPFSA